MGFDLRLPNITGPTDRERLTQIQSYLFQMVEQLNWASQSLDTSNAEVVPSTPRSHIPSVGGAYGVMPAGDDPQSTFTSIKSLIIKSAEIVEAYYQEINRRLESVYVAQSDFGDFAQRTAQSIEETSTSTTQRFENIQVIIAGHDGDIESIAGSLETIGQDISFAQKDIVTLHGSVENLDSSIASVEVAVGGLEADLQTSKQELQGSVAAAKQELTGRINSTKTELEGNVDSTKAEILGNISDTKTELAGDIANTKSELAGSINNAKTELSGSIDQAKAELSGSIDSAKSELSGKVDAVDEDLQTAKTATNERIDDTNESVGNLGVGLNDANSRIADVDQDLQESKGSILNDIQGVRDRVTGVAALIEDAEAQLRGSLDDLEAYVAGLQSVIIGVTAYLKSGLLYYTDAGIPVYGLEIGQSVKDEVAGVEVFNKYARFTSEKLSFYDSNGNEVAYISDKKLFIRIAEITVAFKIGGLMDLVMPNGDVVTKWVGG